MIGNIGPMELVLVLVIALIVLGPKKLPEAGRAVNGHAGAFPAGAAGDRDLDLGPPGREQPESVRRRAV